jgi:hypothetical protein
LVTDATRIRVVSVTKTTWRTVRGVTIASELIDFGDYVVGRTVERVAGISAEEHGWKPVPDAWTVGDDGAVEHAAVPRPDPAPLPTIAWLLWHLANENLCGFAQRAFGIDPLGIPIDRWYTDVDASIDGVRRAWAGFRRGIEEPLMHELLGPAFGPYAEATYAALVLHALDEVVHHGAQVGMTRDLYRLRATA